MDITILFLSSFLAATLLPAGSEIALTTLHLNSEYSAILLVFIATLGNVLGSVTNFILGKYLIHFQNRKWFPIKEKNTQKSEKIFQKYGKFSLLFAWLPIVGDPLTLLAGILKTPFITFLILVTIGKMARYLLLIWLF